MFVAPLLASFFGLVNDVLEHLVLNPYTFLKLYEILDIFFDHLDFLLVPAVLVPNGDGVELRLQSDHQAINFICASELLSYQCQDQVLPENV